MIRCTSLVTVRGAINAPVLLGYEVASPDKRPRKSRMIADLQVSQKSRTSKTLGGTSFEMSGTDYPANQHYIPEERVGQLYAT